MNETMVTLKWANNIFSQGFREGREEGRVKGRQEVVRWMEQEYKRHKGKDLGDCFHQVLSHYYQHEDILLDNQ